MPKRRWVATSVFTIVIVLVIGGWIVSEIRWRRINDPTDKFTNIVEYLAHGRLPSRVAKVKMQEATIFIAYSPMDTWLAIPSAPAAYVFDDSGTMIQWSPDTGDDVQFQTQWPLPHLASSLNELMQNGSEQGVADSL